LKVLTNAFWCCLFVDHFGHVDFGQLKTFGETIRAIREKKDLLLREVAASLKVDPSFLSRVEKGTKRPTREQVVELASILKEDETQLLVLYLSDRVMYELKDEGKLAMKAIMAAEQRIRYKTTTKSKDPRKRRSDK
jgi:transcriptional regulator with XRE-family HTH domain